MNSLIPGIIDNDFDGAGWADRVAIAAHIAFGVVDHELLNFFNIPGRPDGVSRCEIGRFGLVRNR